MLKLNTKRILTLIAFLLITTFFISPDTFRADAKNTHYDKTIETADNGKSLLYAIDEYQEKYFTIIKRNNILLRIDDDAKLKQDKRELKKLYKEVEKHITNKQYLREYKDIKKRYSKCTEETTIGMNEFAQKNYDETDSLLNKTYKEVKSKVSAEEFKNIAASERKWLKELNDYEKTYDSMGYGSIGTMIYLGYQIDMRNFRTLLLMLYL